jgi:hypothetical protein
VLYVWLCVVRSVWVSMMGINLAFLAQLHFISTLCICSVADQFSTVIHQASSTLTLISHFDQ